MNGTVLINYAARMLTTITQSAILRVEKADGTEEDIEVALRIGGKRNVLVEIPKGSFTRTRITLILPQAYQELHPKLLSPQKSLK